MIKSLTEHLILPPSAGFRRAKPVFWNGTTLCGTPLFPLWHLVLCGSDLRPWVGRGPLRRSLAHWRRTADDRNSCGSENPRHHRVWKMDVRAVVYSFRSEQCRSNERELRTSRLRRQTSYLEA